MRRIQPRASWRLRAAVAVVAFAVVASGCLPPPLTGAAVYDSACRNTLVASTPGTVASAAVTELSGISASKKNSGVWWVENDSGHSASVFAVGSDGRDLGRFDLTGGATNEDWEDIAVGPGPASGVSYLYVGDIGDNARSRAGVKVYRVPEPAVDSTQPTPPAPQTLPGAATLTLTYPNGPHDAEALIVDPVSHDLVIVTKELNGTAQVFSTSANFTSGDSKQLVAAGSVALGLLKVVTGGDVSPAGDVVALRTYGDAYFFPRPAGTSLASAFTRRQCKGAVGVEPTLSGEAIGFTADGRGYVTSHEGSHPQLHEFRAP